MSPFTDVVDFRSEDRGKIMIIRSSHMVVPYRELAHFEVSQGAALHDTLQDLQSCARVFPLCYLRVMCTVQLVQH